MAQGPTDARPGGVLTPSELDAVLARYELGRVTSVRELRGGAGASPKALVECSRGRLVLKRWPRAGTDPARIIAAHRVQLALHAADFPTPRLLGDRDANTIVAHAGGLYELSAWIEGEPFGRAAAQARSSGSALARLHALLHRVQIGPIADHQPPPTRPTVEHALNRLESAEPALRGLAERLRNTVAWADHRLAQLGGTPAGEPRGILHGDWHPGNLLFSGPDLVAAFDFDAVRAGSLADELAQGTLQHALDGQHPGSPFDAPLAAAFWAGYARAAGLCPLSPAQASARMIESIALEGVRWGAVALARTDASRAARVLSLAVAAAEHLAARDGQIADLLEHAGSPEAPPR